MMIINQRFIEKIIALAMSTALMMSVNRVNGIVSSVEPNKINQYNDTHQFQSKDVTFYGNWCGNPHGGFQDCCNGGPCKSCQLGLYDQCLKECPVTDNIDQACSAHDICLQGPDSTQQAQGYHDACPVNNCACDCPLMAAMGVSSSAYALLAFSYFSATSCYVDNGPGQCSTGMGLSMCNQHSFATPTCAPGYFAYDAGSLCKACDTGYVPENVPNPRKCVPQCPPPNPSYLLPYGTGCIQQLWQEAGCTTAEPQWNNVWWSQQATMDVVTTDMAAWARGTDDWHISLCQSAVQLQSRSPPSLPVTHPVCGSNNFCVGFEGQSVYCYGSSGGCLWNTNDCRSDADCNKYNTNSAKYTGGPRICPMSNNDGWPADACRTNTVPIYSYYSGAATDHEYTQRPTPYSSDYVLLGIAFYAYGSSYYPSNSVPIYQFHSVRGGVDLYYSPTSTPYSSDWQLDGVAFYAFLTQVTGTSPIYQYYNGAAADHEYTSRPTPYSSSYNLDGVAFYAYLSA